MLQTKGFFLLRKLRKIRTVPLLTSYTKWQPLICQSRGCHGLREQLCCTSRFMHDVRNAGRVPTSNRRVLTVRAGEPYQGSYSWEQATPSLQFYPPVEGGVAETAVESTGSRRTRYDCGLWSCFDLSRRKRLALTRRSSLLRAVYHARTPPSARGPPTTRPSPLHTPRRPGSLPSLCQASISQMFNFQSFDLMWSAWFDAGRPAWLRA